jgi:hypothetical protein
VFFRQDIGGSGSVSPSLASVAVAELAGQVEAGLPALDEMGESQRW